MFHNTVALVEGRGCASHAEMLPEQSMHAVRALSWVLKTQPDAKLSTFPGSFREERA